MVAVEPALDVVPRNLLRFSVRFSHPMSEGWAARCDPPGAVDGAVVPGVFLAMDPELWDAGRRRLTVLLDPARIKRGLAPHREAGYPLAEGEEVRLVVDEAFPDAEGRGLVAAAGATFRVGPDLRGRVRPGSWAVSAPRRRHARAPAGPLRPAAGPGAGRAVPAGRGRARHGQRRPRRPGVGLRARPAVDAGTPSASSSTRRWRTSPATPSRGCSTATWPTPPTTRWTREAPSC